MPGRHSRDRFSIAEGDNIAMNIIFYTQRVETDPVYGERRDCTDQRIAELLALCGYIPMPVPNIREIAENMAKQVHPKGIVFTGGNSLAKYGGDAPERDETERMLVSWGIAHEIPLFGICRGMQFLADCFGGKIASVEGHIATRHEIRGELLRDSVNSYHTLALWEVPKELKVLGTATDGSIEAFCHRELSVMAVGWHPEREPAYAEEDVELIRNFLG